MKKGVFFLLASLAMLVCVAPAVADNDRDFEGTAKVKVVYADVQAGDATLVVEFVEPVTFHRENEAGDAKHMIGKKFFLVADDGRNERDVKKFLATLKVGDEAVLAVEQDKRKVLEVKHLTDEQRKKI